MENINVIVSPVRVKLLEYLYNHEKGYVTQIRSDIECSLQTLYAAKRILEEYGLLAEEGSIRGRGERTYWAITPNGKKVWELLSDIDKTLKSASL